MATKAAGFFEWALDMKFTAAQQQEYAEQLTRNWQQEAGRKSTLDLLENVEKLATASEEKRRQVDDRLHADLLASMRTAKDSDTRWMYEVYRAAHPGFGSQKMWGKWRATKTSSVQYKNTLTGAMAPTNGSIFAYEFNADGTYAFNGLMQITSNGCSTSIYSDHAGKFHTENDVLILEPAKGGFKTQQNCGGSGNQEKPGDLSRKELRFRFEMSDGTPMLVMTHLAGTSKPDYFRQEK